MKPRISTLIVTAAIAIASTITAPTAGARAAADATATSAATITRCGPAWDTPNGTRRRCGQLTDTMSRIGFQNDWDDSYDWGSWYPRAGACIVQRVVVGYDGLSGSFYGFPQFKRSQDGHIITHGTQLAETSKGTIIRLGYYDHQDMRFNETSIVGRWDPHLYPTEPKPEADKCF